MAKKITDINDINPHDYDDPIELARAIKKLAFRDFMESYNALKKSVKAKSH